MEIDSYSSFWQNPVENGTISAGCWSYPDGGLHLGLDIASAMYSDVLAVANGIVLYAHAPVDSNNGYLGTGVDGQMVVAIPFVWWLP